MTQMYNFIYKLKNISYNFLIHTIISYPLHIDAHSEWVFASHFAIAVLPDNSSF